MISRRGFLIGATAAGAVGGCFNAKGATRLDPNRVVFVTDIHIPLPWSEQKYRTGREYPWIVDTVKAHIAEILALDPLPANVISLGDMSIAFGEEKEYAILRELLSPLRDRGIKVTLGMGNHDIRASFAKSFPECAADSLVPGRYVHKVETPYADFVVLDTLKEPKKRGSYPDVTGHELGAAQTDWAKAMLKGLTRPTFICAHHNIGECGLKKEIVRTPQVKGYFHGHHHQWLIGHAFHGYGNHSRTLRTFGVGSFGIDRDIGYAIADLAPDRMTVSIVAKDFYFPAKVPAAERPPIWDEFVRDHLGRKVVYPLG